MSKTGLRTPDLNAAEIVSTRSAVDPKALISIRWLALAGQFVALILVTGVLGFDAALKPALVIVGVGIIFNIWQSWQTARQTRLRRRDILFALHFDVLQLACLLYFTGGLINPFALLFLAPIVVSAAVLDFRSTALLIMFVIICAGILAVSYTPLPWYDTGLVLPDIYVMGVLAALIVSSMFIGFYVWWIADEARRTQAVLAATQLMIERDQQTTHLGILAAAAAHKLGSPLNTISVISHDLRDTLRSDAADKPRLDSDIDEIVTESERCRLILADLNRDLNTERLGDVAAMPVSQVIQGQLSARITAFGDRLSVTTGSLDNSPEPMVSPRTELKYALETLLDNASDFARTSVEFDIGWTRDAIDISIQDDGPGFHPTIMSRIGQPWNSTRDGLSGHRGLGLFLAKTLIESTGGELHINNAEQGGAMIHILVPILSVTPEDTANLETELREGLK